MAELPAAEATGKRRPRMAEGAVRAQMPRLRIEPIDIAIYAILLDHEHGTAGSENVVDLGRSKIVERFSRAERLEISSW